MRITVRKVALFLVGCVVAGQLATRSMEKDPHYAEAMKFVTNDLQVIDQTGAVRSAKMVEMTSVQSGMSVDDKFEPGYDRYRISIQGERASAHVTVERRGQQNATGPGFQIMSID